MEIQLDESSTHRDIMGALELSTFTCFLALKEQGMTTKDIVEIRLHVEKLSATALNMIVLSVDKDAEHKIKNKMAEQFEIEIKNIRDLISFLQNQTRETLQ